MDRRRLRLLLSILQGVRYIRQCRRSVRRRGHRLLRSYRLRYLDKNYPLMRRMNKGRGREGVNLGSVLAERLSTILNSRSLGFIATLRD